MVTEDRDMMINESVLCMLFTFAGLPVRAQQVSVDTTRHLREVTVEAQRIPNNAQASTPTQTLTAADLSQLPSLDVGEALKHLAGLQVRDYGGIGGMKTVDVRGLGSQHTGVVYDGVQVGDCQTGQVDLGRYSLGNVSFLSVTMGQDDDIFQSAKTLSSAAVVHIQTSAFDVPRRLEGLLRTGSYGLAEGELLLSQTWQRLHVSLFADGQRADGIYRFHMKNGVQRIDERRRNSDVNLWRGELNIGYDLTPRQQLRLKTYGYESWRGLPGAVIYDNPLAQERLTDKNTFTQLSYLNRVSENFKVKGALKWNYSWVRDHDVQAQRPVVNTYRQNEVYASVATWMRITGPLTAALATDMQYNHLNMTVHNCQFPTRWSNWNSLALHYQLPWLTAVASLLSTNIWEHVKVGTASPNLHRLSPAFCLSVRPWRHWLLRMGYKSIFRTPTLNDLYYTGVGRRSLQPEKSRQWNLGVTWQHQSERQRVALTLDGYYGHVTDKIVAVPRMFLWQMMNVGKVRQLGLDATARLDQSLGRQWSVNAMISYSLMSATDRTQSTDVYYGDQIAYTPQHSGSGNLTLRTPWLTVGYSLLAVSHRYFLGYNIPANRIGGYADHSLSLSRDFLLGRHQLRTKMTVQNLGGRNYEVVRYYPMAGRNWKLSAEWTL